MQCSHIHTQTHTYEHTHTQHSPSLRNKAEMKSECEGVYFHNMTLLACRARTSNTQIECWFSSTVRIGLRVQPNVPNQTPFRSFLTVVGQSLGPFERSWYQYRIWMVFLWVNASKEWQKISQVKNRVDSNEGTKGGSIEIQSLRNQD